MVNLANLCSFNGIFVIYHLYFAYIIYKLYYIKKLHSIYTHTLLIISTSAPASTRSLTIARFPFCAAKKIADHPL